MEFHDTFDEGKKALKAACVLFELPDRPPHYSFWCSCKHYQHKGVCAHSLSLATKKRDDVEVPAQYDTRLLPSARNSKSTTAVRGGARSNDSKAPATPRGPKFAFGTSL